MLAALFAALAAVGGAHAQPIVTDGNVVGPSAFWTASYRVLWDGDDDRHGSDQYEFIDCEDLEEVRLWIDLAGDSLHVAWKTLAPPYPNRLWTEGSGTHDEGTIGILLDLDADTTTGYATSLTKRGTLTYADPVIGADAAVAVKFMRDGDDSLAWFDVDWQLPDAPVPAGIPRGTAALGYAFDRGVGVNARWIEGAWSVADIRLAWEGPLGYPILRRGDVIGIAGLMTTPVAAGAIGEEITNAGWFLVGWGPVERIPDGLVTCAMRDSSGDSVVVAGRSVEYDREADAFLVDGEPVETPLGWTVTPTSVRYVPDRRLEMTRPAPNPFNGVVSFRVVAPSGDPVSVEIFDLSGRRVARRTVENRTAPALVVWDGRDEAGRMVASGVYLMRVTAGRDTRSVRALLLR